ncbi:MAG: ATP-binding cassette domain-containing protein [Sulfolobales archaeon]
MNKLFLKISDLSLSYDSTQILKSIDLELFEGEPVLLTGLSGSGKTSLLRILSGAIPKIFGGEIRGVFNPNKEIINKYSFYLPQEPWFGIVSPYVWSEISTASKVAEIKYVKDILDRFDMSHLISRSTYTLSAGEVQRLLLIIATLSNKKILLLDEPTSYLDKYNAELFARHITEISKEENINLLIVDHRIDLWSQYLDKIYVLENSGIRSFYESNYARIYWYYNSQIRLLKKNVLENDQEKCIEFKIKGFKYPGSKRYLLQNIEGEICCGEIVLLKGSSGSGKSTLLKILIERIVDGRYSDSVDIRSRGLSIDEVRRDLIFIPDNPLLYFTEPTVDEELRGSQDLLIKIGVPEDRFVLSIKRLSSGERRRVALLSAMIRGKRMVFIDEPTVGLDPYSKYLYLKTLRELADEKKYCFFIASHDPYIEVIADKIIEIN